MSNKYKPIRELKPQPKRLPALPLDEHQSRLVVAHLRLVPATLRRLRRRCVRMKQRDEETLRDLLYDKLIRAAQTFDARRGKSFRSHALTWLLLSGWGDFNRHVVMANRLKTISLDAARSWCAEVDYARKAWDVQQIEPADTQPSPLEAMYQSDFLGKLRKALPERCYEVLRLRYALGLSRAEAGEQMGVSYERVRQIEAQAMECAHAHRDSILVEN